MSKKKEEIQDEVKKDLTVENTDESKNVDNLETSEQTEGANEPDNQVNTPDVQDEVKKDDSKETFKLNVEVPFTDKYDETKHYIVGDVITVSKERFDELMNDSRKLVSENK